MLHVTVFNGTGRVGREVISKLRRVGAKIIIAYRGDRYPVEKMRTAGDLGQIYFAPYSFKDDYSLSEAVKYSDIVVNATGKETETKNFPFSEIHCEGPRRLARIARECGVKKFIHFSALNCSPNPEPKLMKKGSGYYKSKYEGELAVREEFKDATIFRPADILGEQDDFLHHFTSYVRCRFSRKLPLWDYYDGVEKQPVFRGDVSEGVMNAIKYDSSSGQIYQAIGPNRYNFYSLIEYMRACSGRGQLEDGYDITNMRWDPFIKIIMLWHKYLKKHPNVSWDRIERDLTTDYVDPSLPTLVDLGVKLTSPEIIIPNLGKAIPRSNRVTLSFEECPPIAPPPKLNFQ